MDYFIEKPKLKFVQKELQKAISNARSVMANYGADSKRAAEAWDLVEELEHRFSNQKPNPPAPFLIREGGV
ncbi:MAG: CP12 domain-containing protein [Aulosira sp. DedQUE10]|nr:CP12 domain-containing protein [Aulosira sp. DedQUE10]